LATIPRRRIFGGYCAIHFGGRDAPGRSGSAAHEERRRPAGAVPGLHAGVALPGEMQEKGPGRDLFSSVHTCAGLSGRRHPRRPASRARRDAMRRGWRPWPRPTPGENRPWRARSHCAVPLRPGGRQGNWRDAHRGAGCPMSPIRALMIKLPSNVRHRIGRGAPCATTPSSFRSMHVNRPPSRNAPRRGTLK